MTDSSVSDKTPENQTDTVFGDTVDLIRKSLNSLWLKELGQRACINRNYSPDEIRKYFEHTERMNEYKRLFHVLGRAQRLCEQSGLESSGGCMSGVCGSVVAMVCRFPEVFDLATKMGRRPVEAVSEIGESLGMCVFGIKISKIVMAEYMAEREKNHKNMELKVSGKLIH